MAVKQYWPRDEAAVGPANRVGTRMMHLGVAALLARKGIKSSANKGIDVKYTWRAIKKDSRAQPNSFRLQPFANEDFYGEEKDYMKLRNFSFNVFKENWGGHLRGKETERQAAARHLWTGAYPGSDMANYRIRGSEGAQELMDSQAFHYKEQGMEMILMQLSRVMIRSFIQFAGKPERWDKAVKKAGKNIGRYSPVGTGEYTMVGGGLKGSPIGGGFRFHKTRRGGLPVIGADSVEEAQLYVLNALLKNKINIALKGKEVDVQTGLTLAGRRGTKRLTSQRIDISKKHQREIFEVITKWFMQTGGKGAKNPIQWEKGMTGWAATIEDYDVGMQPLEKRFELEWKAFSKKYNMEAIKNLNDLKKFVDVLEKKAQQFKVSTPIPRTTKPASSSDSKGRTGDVGQFARRLRQLKGRTYIFTQPLEVDGRAIISVSVLNDVPTFTVGYIPGPSMPLGTAISKYLLGNARESRFTAALKYMSERGYAIFNNEALRITESMGEFTFYTAGGRPEGLYPMTTMVAPLGLAKSIKLWIDSACGQWWSDSSWDELFDPSQMSGHGFAKWFQYWVEKSKKVGHQIDNAAGTPGWGRWLADTVTPKYMREGGERPKGRRPPGSQMMPYDASRASRTGVGGPRTWHSPLYARPYFIQDNWGKKSAAGAERDAYATFIEQKKMLTYGSWRFGPRARKTTGGMDLSQW